MILLFYKVTVGSGDVNNFNVFFVVSKTTPYYVATLKIFKMKQNNYMRLNDIFADSFEYVQLRSKGIQLEEALILFVVVGLWVCAMVLFIKQWDNIRIIQPQETRYKHSPKNLDTVKIVKKPQDSVIYKNYSRKMSLTMVEREKKLLRMNTVPIMENVASLQTLNAFKKLSTIEMEDGIQEENDSVDVSSNV